MISRVVSDHYPRWDGGGSNAKLRSFWRNGVRREQAARARCGWRNGRFGFVLGEFVWVIWARRLVEKKTAMTWARRDVLARKIALFGFLGSLLGQRNQTGGGANLRVRLWRAALRAAPSIQA
ncbi:MAG: hypothetical protein RLZZ157_27 [Pseudomonadota bacterium]